MPIPFTQYLLPDGRRAATSIDMPEEIEAMAQEIRAKGYRFESEVLRNGMVSLTVVSPHDDEGDIAIKVGSNGPGVPEMVEALVRDAFKKLK